MTSQFGRTRIRRRSAGARVFDDAAGRLWSAAFTQSAPDWAVVFACITDARQPIRAIALTEDGQAAELGESTLRDWLERAPRLEPLI